MPDMQTVNGGCHCGAVRFEAKADLTQAMECNCSHCEKKGFILTFTPRANFALTTGEGALSEYRFNKKSIAHKFCKTCGVQPFAYGAMPDGAEMAAINLRCVDEIDLSSLSPQKVDGRSF